MLGYYSIFFGSFSSFFVIHMSTTTQFEANYFFMGLLSFLICLSLPHVNICGGLWLKMERLHGLRLSLAAVCVYVHVFT